jgi:hypothetical protein
MYFLPGSPPLPSNSPANPLSPGPSEPLPFCGAISGAPNLSLPRAEARFSICEKWKNPLEKLEAIAKPDFTVILNEVKDLKSLKIRDPALCSE